MSRKVVFFDRDDTLIEDKIYLNKLEEVKYLENAFDCLKKLKNYNYEFVIVTNQSGIARQLVDIENLHKIHLKIRNDYAKHGIDILGFYYAPYLPATNHWLRKPNPGMLLEAKIDFNIDLTQSWMVGDRMTDVEAGKRAGTKTILLGNKELPQNSAFDPPDYHLQNLNEVYQCISSEIIT